MDYQMMQDIILINNIMDILYSIAPISLYGGIALLILSIFQIKQNGKFSKLLGVISILMIVLGIIVKTIISNVMFN